MVIQGDEMFDAALHMMDEAAMAAALAARNEDAQILGVFDVANKTDAAIDARRLGEAIQFVANAPILGYDVRAAMIMYGEPGRPTLRARDCELLWARYGEALLR
jgi:Xaa-Pro aminopeptidase